MDIHVICVNDSVEYAVINDMAKAEEKLSSLKEEYWTKNKWGFDNDRNSYDRRMYWHIHTVPGE